MDTDVAAQLQALLDGPYADVRQQTRRLLIDLGLEKAGGLDRDTYRDLVLQWCRELAQAGAGARSFPAGYGGQDDDGAAIAGFQTRSPAD